MKEHDEAALRIALGGVQLLVFCLAILLLAVVSYQ
jgi:hypothetical protein